jgi:ribosomal protein S4E
VVLVIRKVKEGYRVVSESGRNMGTYPTKEEAKKRLQQIEYFKHKKKT